MSEEHETQGDWYCPGCGCYLSACRVTNAELCDTCHTPVIWDDASNPRTVEELLAEIAHLRGLIAEFARGFADIAEIADATREAMNAIVVTAHNKQRERKE